MDVDVRNTGYDPGLDVEILRNPLGFKYGAGVYGPEPEQRMLDQIRASLRDPDSVGPEVVYSIAMDVAKEQHRKLLEERMLLFGIVTYASGQIGDEPIRSQGHIHQVSNHSGWSPPEIYEIWSGKAYIYMQEKASDQPGRCFAVLAEAGDVVVVPPFWAHATISADPQQPLTFGAWCDREYGFEYEEVKAHKGLAWYPIIQDNGEIRWIRNENYDESQLIIKNPGDYSQLGIQKNKPIYEQFEADPDLFQFVSKPGLKGKDWISFTP
jgi:glucose-6-phosphate isomerase